MALSRGGQWASGWRSQVNRAQSKAALPCPKSSDRSRPDGRRLGAKAAKGGSADQMALDIEGVVDRRVGGEESLG